ncbi:hypothetical protein BDW42DRAFT_194813 [Aspergillus taichungensis]|uniref:Uncharacterized protein n=1 Tax=Aspergillus taichungensis TaxID=482145 RepID=A0A2J5HRS2_9EURO|nr:hypothetical protein BDW42DRAFT_194813 [Aspergillus taichungensis]
MLRLLRTPVTRAPINRVPAVISSRVVARKLHPEVHSIKGDDFYLAPTFPDDFESPTMYRNNFGTSHWDEIHATLSEASVKADRGDVSFETVSEMGMEGMAPDEMVPKLDEM